MKDIAGTDRWFGIFILLQMFQSDFTPRVLPEEGQRPRRRERREALVLAVQRGPLAQGRRY